MSDDLALIGLGADTSGLRKGEIALDRFAKKGEQTEKNIHKSTSNMEKNFNRLKLAAAGLTTVFAGIAVNKMIQDFRAFETGLIGVTKTTGLAGRELDTYVKQIRAVSKELPITTGELLSLSQTAGQMGVTGAANLEKFAVTIAKLGRASDLAGEEAAKSLARILNVTGESIDTIDTLASVIVSLGNNSAATESEIARMTTEVARATNVFDVTSAEAAAMAAAMSSIGIQAELGGSSVGRAMQQITSRVQAGGKDLREFADVLDLNAETLTKLFAENKTKAFEYFLQQVGELGLDAGNALKEVDLGGQEIAKTIIPLANNMGIFAEAMALANAEVENATALEREFAATLETLDSQIVIAQNRLKALGMTISTEVMPQFTELLKSINDIDSEDLETLGDSLILVASIYAGRLVSSIATATAIKAKDTVATYQQAMATKAATASEIEFLRANQASLSAQLASAAGSAKSAALRSQLSANTAALTRATLAHNAAIHATSITARTATGAMMGLRGVMALFGGPVGVAVTAAAAIWLFRDSLFGADGDINSLNDELDKTLSRMNAIKEASVVSPLEKAVEKSKEHLKSLKAEADQLEKVIEVYKLANQEGSIRTAHAKNQAEILKEQIPALEKQIKLTENIIKITKAGTRQMSSGFAVVAASIESVSDQTEENTTKVDELLVAETNLKNSRTEYYQEAIADAQRYANELQNILDKLYPQKAEVRRLMAEWDTLYSHAISNGKEMPKVLQDWIDQNVMIQTTTRKASDAVKDLSDEAEPFGKIWETTIERLQGSIADMFYEMLETGKVTFDNILNLFKRMAAEMAAQKIMLSFGGKGEGGQGGFLDSLFGGSGGGNSSGFSLQNLMSMKNLSGGVNGMVSGLGGYVNMLPESISGGFVQTGAGMVSDAAFEQAVMEGGLNQGWNLNAGYGALATAGAGIAGGYAGNFVGEAAFGKQAESNYGAMAGGAIGAYVGAGASIGGPWGAAIGAFIGALVDVLGGGDGKVRSALGVQTNPGWRGADKGKSPIQIEAESGLLLTAYAKRAGDEASKMAEELTKIFGATDSALTGIYETLGNTVDLAGKQLDGINSEAGNNDPTSSGFFGSAEFNGGLSNEALKNAPDEFVLSWIKKVNELNDVKLDLQPIFDLKKEGEVLADVLIRVNNEFNSVNKMLEAIGLTAYETSVSGMVMSDGLAAAFGGLDKMSEAMSNYQSLAYDESERLDTLQNQLTETFEKLNVVMPENIDGLREIVEGLDRTTQEGKETFAALVQIAPAFHQITEAAKEAAEREKQISIDSAREKLSLLESTISEERNRITEIHDIRMEQLNSERSAIEDVISASRDNVDAVFAAFERGIAQQRSKIEEQSRAEIDMLNGQREAIISNYDLIASGINSSILSVQETVQRLKQEAAALRNALGKVSVGDVATILGRQQKGVSAISNGAQGNDLDRAIEFATAATAEMFSNRSDFERNQSRAGQAISGRLSGTESEISNSEAQLENLQNALNNAAIARDKQLDKLDDQIQAIVDHRDKALAGLDQQVELAQKQIDSINGTATNVATLTDVTKAIATYEQVFALSTLQLEKIDKQIRTEENQFKVEMEYLDFQLKYNNAMFEKAVAQEATLNNIYQMERAIAQNIGEFLGKAQDMMSESGGFATGGIASGPTSGYWERLHGTEAIVPLESGGGIPVNVRGNSNDDLIVEIQALRSEVRELRSEASQIRSNTGDSASYQKRSYYKEKIAAE